MLQSTLTARLRGASASAAACGVEMMAKQMLLLPVRVSALCPRQPSGALGAVSVLQPWGRQSAKLGKDTVKLVEADEILLPLTYAKASILIQCQGAGVFNMAVAAGCGLLIRDGIQVPVGVGDVSKLGFVPGQMCFNPTNSRDFVFLGENTAPEILMLDTCNRSPLEGAGECVRDIATVSQDVQPALGPLEGMEYGEEFGPLRRLVATIDGSMETVSVEKGKAPTCTEPSGGTATAIRRRPCDCIGDENEWGPRESLSNLCAEGPRIV